jgi:hypothetical protein
MPTEQVATQEGVEPSEPSVATVLDDLIKDIDSKLAYIRRIRKENPKEHDRQLSQIVPLDVLTISQTLARELQERTDILLQKLTDVAVVITEEIMPRLEAVEAGATDEDLIEASLALAKYVVGQCKDVPEDVLRHAEYVLESYEEGTEAGETTPEEANATAQEQTTAGS